MSADWNPSGRVLRNPRGAAQWLNSGVVTGVNVTVHSSSVESVVFTVAFEPPPSWALPGYPAELTRVLITSSGGPVAVPVGPDRTWRHRYPLSVPTAGSGVVSLEFCVGALCLWNPKDPVALRWTWDKGLDDFVRIVQRHLWMEEYCRRNGEWPGEETPHGERLDGRPHPIVSEDLRSML